jgi:hypothetical protein
MFMAPSTFPNRPVSTLLNVCKGGCDRQHNFYVLFAAFRAHGGAFFRALIFGGPAQCLLEPELLFIVCGCRRPNAEAPAAAVCGTTDRQARMQAGVDGRDGGLRSNV